MPLISTSSLGTRYMWFTILTELHPFAARWKTGVSRKIIFHRWTMAPSWEPSAGYIGILLRLSTEASLFIDHLTKLLCYSKIYPKNPGATIFSGIPADRLNTGVKRPTCLLASVRQQNTKRWDWKRFVRLLYALNGKLQIQKSQYGVFGDLVVQ